MPDLQQAATFVIACGGVGAFIDFYLGKPGQKKIKDRLETFWIGLAYVNFRTFARAKPAHAFVLITLQRIVDSDKPIFTFVFAATAAIGKFIETIAKLIGQQ
jgi:hypothetical protein